jgi:hypothetical protein
MEFANNVPKQKPPKLGGDCFIESRGYFGVSGVVLVAPLGLVVPVSPDVLFL